MDGWRRHMWVLSLRLRTPGLDHKHAFFCCQVGPFYLEMNKSRLSYFICFLRLLFDHVFSNPSSFSPFTISCKHDNIDVEFNFSLSSSPPQLDLWSHRCLRLSLQGTPLSCTVRWLGNPLQRSSGGTLKSTELILSSSCGTEHASGG